MATKKVNRRLFSGFTGYDATSDSLNDNPLSATTFTNLERLPNGSFRARQGYKQAAQDMYMERVFNYLYIDSDGVAQEEIIGVGVPNIAKFDSGDIARGKLDGHLFRRKSGTFTISYSGGSNWGASVLPGSSSGDPYELILSEGGSTVLTQTFGTLKTLADAINGITNFSCTAPVTAVVNGAQNGVSTVTVDSGHTIAVGDWVYFQSSVTATNGNGYEFFEVIATTSTTISFSTVSTRDFTDDQVLGHGNYTANILDLQTLSEASQSSMEITYNYWEPIPSLMFRHSDTVFDYPFSNLQDNFGHLEYKHPDFENHKNSCLISSNYATKVDLVKVINGQPNLSFEAGVWKYDGANVYLYGPINFTEAYGSDISNYATIAQYTSGTALPAGDYQYQFSILKTDAQGYELESFLEYIHTHTQAATKDVLITIKATTAGAGTEIFAYTLFDIRYAQCGSTESTATTTFTVNTGHLLRTGDYVYFKDNTDVRQKRKVTGWTNTTITIDSSATIASGNVISNALIRAWRTKVDAITFLLAKEEPAKLDASNNTFIRDDTTDDNLGIKLTAVKQETIQYNFPRVSTLASHQGVLVAGGGPKLRQKILWEDPLYPESADLARTARDVPSVSSSSINNLVSQKNSSLLIVKGGAIYSAVGSFSSGDVEITQIVENSYGADSTLGCCVLFNTIFGCSGLGLWETEKGSNDINPYVGEALLNIFRDKGLAASLLNDIESRRIQVNYDVTKQWIRIYAPREVNYSVTNMTASDHYAPSVSGKEYVLMLPQMKNQELLWSVFSYTNTTNPAGGIVYHKGKTFHQSRYRSGSTSWGGKLFERIEDEANLPTYMFQDAGVAIPWGWSTPFMHEGTPEYEKTWHELKIHQHQSAFFIDSFTINFESYRDWTATTAKKDTERTLTFANSGVYEVGVTFDKNYKAKSRSFVMSGTAYLTSPLITGISYTYDAEVIRQDKYGRDTQ